MTEKRPHEDQVQKDSLIRNVEGWLAESGGKGGKGRQGLKNPWLKPVAILLTLSISAICLALCVFLLVYLLFALVG